MSKLCNNFRLSHPLSHHQRTDSNTFLLPEAKPSANTAILEARLGIDIAAIKNLIFFTYSASHLIQNIDKKLKKYYWYRSVKLCIIWRYFIIKDSSANTFNMLPSTSSRMFSRTSSWFFLLTLIYFLLLSGLPVEARAPTKKNATIEEKTATTLFESLKTNPWSNIKGFRSAKFGDNEKSVHRAIAKDFKIAKSKVKKSIHPSEKTTTLEIVVPDLFSIGGTAKVTYILGYKSKKLMHVNLLWGQGATGSVDGKDVIDLANLLRAHFLTKRYKEKGLAANAPLSDTQNILFRGRDQKNRVVILFLSLLPTKEGTSQSEREKLISLSLSYMADPENPDVRKLKIGADEF